MKHCHFNPLGHVLSQTVAYWWMYAPNMTKNTFLCIFVSKSDRIFFTCHIVFTWFFWKNGSRHTSKLFLEQLFLSLLNIVLGHTLGNLNLSFLELFCGCKYTIKLCIENAIVIYYCHCYCSVLCFCFLLFSCISVSFMPTLFLDINVEKKILKKSCHV